MENPSPSAFNRDRHVRYWLRCLKTLLPTNYVSGESQRMLLACFTLAALDLLDALHSNTTVGERASYADWLYHCQHPDGGFRGFTGTITQKDWMRKENDGISASHHWDPANIAGTFFALAALGVLGDNLKRVRRRECLRWLRKLQWEDGSFAEVLGEDGRREGGQDGRLAFLALLVRKILRYGEFNAEEEEEEEDIDTGGVTSFILQARTYEGGFAQSPLNEAQGGSSYCGIGVLSLLGKLPIPSRGSYASRKRVNGEGDVSNEVLQDTLRYLVYRQTCFEDENVEMDVQVKSAAIQEALHVQPSTVHEKIPSLAFSAQGSSLPSEPSSLSLAAVTQPIQLSRQVVHAGLNGRCNKVADTCYSWWAGGSLDILGKFHLLDVNANRRFLLDKTQHIIGGFGKLPGEPPDILHSYLGLAALSLMKEPGLKSIDPIMCISLGAREHLDRIPFAAYARVAGNISVSSKEDPHRRVAADEAKDEFKYMATGFT